MLFNRRDMLKATAAAAALAGAGARAEDLGTPVAARSRPFPLDAVRLLPSLYRDALSSNRRYLMSLEPDRLLHNFRLHAGLVPKAALYGGWESDSIAGHTLGHYLSALSLLHAQMGDAQAPHRVRYIVTELSACQATDGYVGGFTRRRGEIFEDGRFAMEEVKRGDIRARIFDLNGAWSPLYNWHKLMAGLLDADRYCGEKTAIAVASRLGAYIEGMFAALGDAQVQQVLLCEYGGLNESFAELYARTHDRRWLALSRRLYDRRILDPLAEGHDELANQHANTQIPKLIGLQRLYELTGEGRHHQAARFFWETVTSRYSYVIGGNADREYFTAPRTISTHITEQTCESCNTYNMLKLTRQLYAAEPRAVYFDYYERAHFNQILAQHHPHTGMFAYMMPLMAGTHREFSSPTADFWCCVGSGMESHAKHGDSIYWHAGDTLYVNLYIASTLHWAEQRSHFELHTEYPLDDRVELRVRERLQSTPLTLALRVPGWCTQPRLALNGREMVAPVRDGYIELRRQWHSGDIAVLTLPRLLWIEPTPDDPKTIAILQGPMVLAADLGDVAQKWVGPAPALVGTSLLSQIEVNADKPPSFVTRRLGRPGDFVLRPFTLQYERSSAVYFRHLDEAEWQSEQTRHRDEEARERDVAARVVDAIVLGDISAEHDHQLEARISNAVVYRGRLGRDARAGGYFELRLATRPEQLILQASYWGEEADRHFSIMLDGTEVARETLNAAHAGEFFDRHYPLPLNLTSGKSSVIVRVQPIGNVTAGPVFGMRLLQVEPLSAVAPGVPVTSAG
jgi:uncharacterized protein